jgi:hypothetical protein
VVVDASSVVQLSANHILDDVVLGPASLEDARECFPDILLGWVVTLGVGEEYGFGVEAKLSFLLVGVVI